MCEDTAVNVREATTQDLEAVTELWVKLMDFHNALDERVWNRAPDGRRKFREWMESALTDAQRAVLVAETEGQSIGFVHAMLKDSPPVVMPRKSGFVTDLVVAAERRRGGTGRRLFRAVEAWCREQGADEVTLTAAVRNEGALAFWRAMGFEPCTYTMSKPLGQ
jgi:ribosomal protein S18 acetylase RimI-like enzyme